MKSEPSSLTCQNWDDIGLLIDKTKLFGEQNSLADTWHRISVSLKELLDSGKRDTMPDSKFIQHNLYEALSGICAIWRVYSANYDRMTVGQEQMHGWKTKIEPFYERVVCATDNLNSNLEMQIINCPSENIHTVKSLKLTNLDIINLFTELKTSIERL
jgi:hypothetical protein